MDTLKNNAENLSFKNYFSSREWIFIFIIISIGLLLRWIMLDLRPYHHDESLNAIYGLYIFYDPVNKFYKYQALLHGPLLYNLYPFIYKVFGVSNWSARMPMALLGSFFIFMPIIFRKFFSKNTIIFLTTLLALSPNLIYWSRFIRHDFLVICCFLFTIYGATHKKPFQRLFGVTLGIIIPFCIKENAYVTVSILLGYFIYESIITKLILKDKNHQTFFSKIYHSIKGHPYLFIMAFAVGSIIYCYLYSAGLVYPKGILDGLYRESLSYWFNQHSIERIKGPFLFQFFQLSWYESFFIFAFLFHMIHFYVFNTKHIRIAGFLLLCASSIIYLQYKYTTYLPFGIWDFFKLKIPIDIIGLVIFFIHPVLLTTAYLIKKEYKMAFWGYLFTSSLFTYSYLGEKVPWLSLYIFFPGIIYLSFYLENIIRNSNINFKQYSLVKFLTIVAISISVLSVIFILETSIYDSYPWAICSLIVFTISYVLIFKKMDYQINLQIISLGLICFFYTKISILTNFTNAGRENEFIGQVHTSPKFHRLAEQIRFQFLTPLKGYRPKVLTLNESIWPMTWYARDFKRNYFFRPPPKKFNNKFHYIIKRPLKKEIEFLKSKFNLQIIPLRHWWVPDYIKMNFKKFLKYAFDHTPWNPPGHLPVLFASKKGELDLEERK